MDTIIKYLYDEDKKILTDFGRFLLISVAFWPLFYLSKFFKSES